MSRLSKNQKQICMIAEAAVSGSAPFCQLVAGIAKGIDGQCKCDRILATVKSSGNVGVLANNIINDYNTGQGTFPGAFQGSYANKPRKRKDYYKRLFGLIDRALQSVYSNDNALAGMAEEEVKDAVGLFWKQLII